MILGTKSRYAVIAMVDLALNTDGRKPVCLADISARQEISLAYLEQIFPRLRKAGLVTPVRGPGGGYLLAKGHAETTVADIVVAADESLQMTRCSSGKGEKGCMKSGAQCLTHDLWEGLGNQIHAYLSAISLQDVCERLVKQKHGCVFLYAEAKKATPHYAN